MKKLWMACLGALILTVTGLAATVGRHSLTVPFSQEDHRVIIPTSVNGSKALKLLLDTGMRFDGVYLFHKEALSLVDTTGAVQVRVGGAGSGEASTATMIETARLAFGDVAIESQRVVISHSEQTQGFSTDGVIGWSLFGHYIVEIDYDQDLIILHDTAFTVSDFGFLNMPIELKEKIPFLDVVVEVKEGEAAPMRVYIDLASREALELLLSGNQKFTTPDSLTDTLLGTGLSGDIYGSYGKTTQLQIGKYALRAIHTAFAPATVRSKQEGADGILGNDLIRRFNAIFDYPHQRLYLKPNKTYGLPFD